ncbi:Uncharacterised protein [Acholeplasma oculi]|uniref:DUF2238 domain-containing protein n=1 Tax=Acholeplasma oculi TaxID=35623 RepID=A0A061AC90_9MOLU|nr:hypothetical protein [Acholeplasma oculi]CDR31495.1 hypothetical protein Aocu_14220 [Acholeplasma oculi]SKC49371.1 hypothetical protein SAMN02745122_1400 [Acholeplasma oculi]SUT92252.1 Uncharacterised protein [Acholeplasma oculi]
MTKKITRGFIYGLLVSMILIALYLWIQILITGIDPTKRLTSHIATMVLSLSTLIYGVYLKKGLHRFVFTFSTIYIFFAVFLGSTLNFYNLYESIHYDKLIHVYFGYSATLVGLVFISRLEFYQAIKLKHVLIFIFSFSLMIAACWELLEFASDQLFSTTTQGRPQMTLEGIYSVDVGETMFDIIANLIGTLIFMASYSIEKRFKKTFFMKRILSILSE